MSKPKTVSEIFSQIPDELYYATEAFPASSGSAGSSEAPLIDVQTLTGSDQYRPEDARGVGDESSAAAHEWEWHATGAGMGWNCWKCDTHYPFTALEDMPPDTGCPETGSLMKENTKDTPPEGLTSSDCSDVLQNNE